MLFDSCARFWCVRLAMLFEDLIGFDVMRFDSANINCGSFGKCSIMQSNCFHFTFKIPHRISSPTAEMLRIFSFTIDRILKRAERTRVFLLHGSFRWSLFWVQKIHSHFSSYVLEERKIFFPLLVSSRLSDSALLQISLHLVISIVFILNESWWTFDLGEKKEKN